jgi:hypothetical protein
LMFFHLFLLWAENQQIENTDDEHRKHECA